MVVRARDGTTLSYPVVRTEQRDSQCHTVVVPSGIPPQMVQAAQDVAKAAVG